MQYINQFAVGNLIDGVYLCEKKDRMIAKNNNPYFNVILKDKTGNIGAKVWNPDDATSIHDFNTGDFVHVTGNISEYGGNLQFEIRTAEKATTGQYDPADYIPVSEKDINTMWDHLNDIIDKHVTTPFYLRLLEEFFDKDQDFIDAFKFSSAAKRAHHAFVGGLLEHTIGVAENCIAFAKMHPMIDESLLVTAALLHDIGKTVEIAPFPTNDFSDMGRLVGHVVLSYQMTTDKVLATLKPLSQDDQGKLMRLQHCILAHHGELEYGSPKKPALLEAEALCLADLADSKLKIFENAVNRIGENAVWSDFEKLIDSYVMRT